MKAIEAQALRLVYPSGLFRRPTVALAGLDIEIEEGEIFGYLGPNGAGKTTTIKILAGITRPSSGRARVFGKAAGSIDARRLTGYLPEEPYFYEYLQAEEALRLYGRLSGLSRWEARRRASEVLERVGLYAERRRRLGEFSRGMRQRFGFAQAVIHTPRLVFLDEPMSGLDPLGRIEIREMILALKDRGTTVFFSSHILPDVEMICDRVGILDKGKLRALGRLDSLLPKEAKCVEVVAEGVEKGTVQELSAISSGVRLDGTTIVARVDDEGKANVAIDIVRKGGGRIKAIVPQRITLEEAFLRTSCNEDKKGSADGSADNRG